MGARERVTITLSEELLPPMHPEHGTPHPVVRRVIAIAVEGKTATWEQTDYGHPGRFNPPDPRGVPIPLQPLTPKLAAAARAAAELIA